MLQVSPAIQASAAITTSRSFLPQRMLGFSEGSIASQAWHLVDVNISRLAPKPGFKTNGVLNTVDSICIFRCAVSQLSPSPKSASYNMRVMMDCTDVTPGMAIRFDCTMQAMTCGLQPTHPPSIPLDKRLESPEH
ncbi:hypothetical protein J3458_007244 [Metarhizium acridum]|uniref:uncharacterized protein n=1 Tax=Metarhizium acridum TaxID=92637 RepID=UPI001C6C4353|nr:hypothetical protein J3458_007244 [Metarhizium acridum]